MTLGEGKRKVYMLLDEYGSGDGVDEDLEAKMNDLFDMAQKDVAKVSKVVKTIVLSGVGAHEMPEGFLAVQRIWKEGKNVTRSSRWRGGKLMLLRDETVELDYYAAPDTIGPDTPDDWLFEVKEDACEAMLFYVAGMVLSSDLVQDAGQFFELYERARQQLSGGVPGYGGHVANRLYGG